MKKTTTRLVALLITVSLLVTLTACTGPINGEDTPKPKTAVHFIDVGQGDSILIKTESKAILIDGGERNQGSKVVDYLRVQGVTKLDLVIATHPHSDHIGGLIAVLESLPVERVIDPGVPHTSNTYLTFLELIEEKGISFHKAKHEVIELGQGRQLEIFAPQGDYSSLNNYSVVARLLAEGVSVLFTGDLEQEGEKELMQTYDLAADVLKVGHHGSSTSTSPEFLEHVNPKYAVILVGAGNDYGHPHREILARLSDIDIYRTDLLGHIVLTIDDKDYSFDIDESILRAVAAISDPRPTQNSTIEASVQVVKGGKPVAGAKVTLNCAYKSSTSTYVGITDSEGIATIPFSIGRASKGYKVVVTAEVEHEGQQVTATTSFTPR